MDQIYRLELNISWNRVSIQVLILNNGYNICMFIKSLNLLTETEKFPYPKHFLWGLLRFGRAAFLQFVPVPQLSMSKRLYLVLFIIREDVR